MSDYDNEDDHDHDAYRHVATTSEEIVNADDIIIDRVSYGATTAPGEETTQERGERSSGVYTALKPVPVAPNKICTHSVKRQICPVCSHFGSTWMFWRQLTQAFGLGALVGLVTWILVQPMQRLSKAWWWDPLSPSALDEAKLLHGKVEWVALFALVGLVIGSLKVWLDFPENPVRYFTCLHRQYVDYRQVIKVVIISSISVCGGGALGPTSVIGNAGGGFGQLVGEWAYDVGTSTRSINRLCLIGLVCGLAALLPSPLGPTILVLELQSWSSGSRHYLANFCDLGVGIVAAYATYNMLSDHQPFLPFVPLNLPESDKYTFKTQDVVIGALFGVLSAAVSAIMLVIHGASKFIFAQINNILHDNIHAKAAKILSPALGGATFGALACIVPLAMLSGASQLRMILQNHEKISSNPAWFFTISALSKATASAICISSGWFGGILFPSYFVGSSVGIAVYHLLKDTHYALPFLLTESCFFAAVPCAIFPMPIFHILNTAVVLGLQGDETLPMFVSSITVSLIFGGLGLHSVLLRLQAGRNLPATTQS